MKAIWKYPLEVTDEQIVRMPSNAEILSVQTQNGQPCVWALVDPDAPTMKERFFRVYGTGHPIDQDGKFIGTFQIHGGALVGALVFHLFEV